MGGCRGKTKRDPTSPPNKKSQNGITCSELLFWQKPHEWDVTVRHTFNVYWRGFDLCHCATAYPHCAARRAAGFSPGDATKWTKDTGDTIRKFPIIINYFIFRGWACGFLFIVDDETNDWIINIIFKISTFKKCTKCSSYCS